MVPATQGLTLGTQTEPQRTKVDDMPFLSAPDPRPSYDTQTDAYSGSEFTKQTQQQFVTTAGAIDTFEVRYKAYVHCLHSFPLIVIIIVVICFLSQS